MSIKWNAEKHRSRIHGTRSVGHVYTEWKDTSSGEESYFDRVPSESKDMYIGRKRVGRERYFGRVHKREKHRSHTLVGGGNGELIKKPKVIAVMGRLGKAVDRRL
jgi:hypothetical protein